MIPVAADHAPDVVDRQILPRGISDVLPTGYFLQNKQAQFVARLQEMPRLRIVRGAHDIALELLAEDFGIPPLYATRHRRSHEREVLMAVEASQLHDPAVELETALGEARGAESEGAGVVIDDAPVAHEPNAHCVEVRVIDIPPTHGRQLLKPYRVA
jgi:hypothetical protein